MDDVYAIESLVEAIIRHTLGHADSDMKLEYSTPHTNETMPLLNTDTTSFKEINKVIEKCRINMAATDSIADTRGAKK